MTPVTYARRSSPPPVTSSPCSSTLIVVSMSAVEMSASLLIGPDASVSVARLQLLHCGCLTGHNNNNNNNINNEDYAVASVSSSPAGTAGGSSLQIRAPLGKFVFPHLPSLCLPTRGPHGGHHNLIQSAK